MILKPFKSSHLVGWMVTVMFPRVSVPLPILTSERDFYCAKPYKYDLAGEPIAIVGPFVMNMHKVIWGRIRAQTNKKMRVFYDFQLILVLVMVMIMIVIMI